MIPTCPFAWPNGQGDVAKFLEGEANTVNWRKKYGQVYRIWSGMTPEMYACPISVVDIAGC